MARPRQAKRNAQPRSRKPRSVRVRRGRGAMPRPKHDISHICALTDPFCPHALGAKWPDGSGGNSISYQTRYFYTVSTDANGNAAWLFQPGIPSVQMLNAGDTGGAINSSTGNVTWPTTVYSDPNYSTFGTNFQSYRIVSAGIRYETTAAWTVASGTMLVGISPTTFSSGTFNTRALNAYLESQVLPIRDAKVQSIGRFADQTESHNFQGLAFTSANQFVMYPIFFGFSGAPASTALGTIEIYVNYEFRTIPGNFMSAMAERVPPQNTTLTTIANDIQTSVPTMFNGLTQDQVSKAIEKVISNKTVRSMTSTVPGASVVYEAYDLYKAIK